MTDGPFFGSSPRPSRRTKRPEIFPTEMEIVERAYQLFIADDMRSERVSDYWQRAEEELLDRAARKVIR